ncbi:hypothetical protein D3875_11695 [Deinococcus cavernae]|uniref:Uncharacterized protein n=1 Tax=Deinococcus cavernae TaxID=2320857 RepID=A0A418VC22_9DEIO|nr:hypothetical protein D3875_11695 [Deinococcus cavernae]
MSGAALCHAFARVNPLEQVSEFRHTWNGTPYDSILRPARLNSLAPLGQKALRSFVKCSTVHGCSCSPVWFPVIPGPC